jgi:uncharacterized protein YuzE
MGFEFGFSVETDKRTGSTLAVYLRVRHGKARRTREYADGNAFADYDKKGRLLGIELLGPCQVEILDEIAEKDEPRVRQFLHTRMPKRTVWTDLQPA